MKWMVNPYTSKMPIYAREYLLHLGDKNLLIFLENLESPVFAIAILSARKKKYDLADEKDMKNFLEVAEVDNLNHKIIEMILEGNVLQQNFMEH